MNNSKLLEVAPAEIAVPLKVTHAGRAYRVRHVLRSPKPADWFAYEAALEMAVEELPGRDDSGEPFAADAQDEPTYRLHVRSADAALTLWHRLALRVEGYALPQAQAPSSAASEGRGLSPAVNHTPTAGPSAPEASLSGPGFSERSGDPALLAGSPDKTDAARSASLEGFTLRPKAEESRGNPLQVSPQTVEHKETNWRELIPLAHKEAAIRSLTLVAPAQSAHSNGFSPNSYFPLAADEVPVTLEAVVAGVAYPRLVHRFRPPTVDDERAYRRLVAETLLVRGARAPRTLIPPRLPALVKLYDSLIVAVEGYAFNDHLPGSSLQLIQQLDAWHKRVAVQTLFGDLVAEETAPASVADPQELLS